MSYSSFPYLLPTERARDTTFVQWADSVAQEVEALSDLTLPNSSLSISYGDWKEYLRTILARYAYDVVKYGFQQTMEASEAEAALRWSQLDFRVQAEVEKEG